MAHWVNLNSASGFVFKLLALWICNNKQFLWQVFGTQAQQMPRYRENGWTGFTTDSYAVKYVFHQKLGYKVIFVRKQRGCCRRIRIACKVDHRRLRHNLCSCKKTSGLPGFKPWPAFTIPVQHSCK